MSASACSCYVKGRPSKPTFSRRKRRLTTHSVAGIPAHRHEQHSEPLADGRWQWWAEDGCDVLFEVLDVARAGQNRADPTVIGGKLVGRGGEAFGTVPGDPVQIIGAVRRQQALALPVRKLLRHQGGWEMTLRTAHMTIVPT